ncbi:MAG TPA: DUF4382 domain-containing protein [Dehalococcoidia bacterium]|nr:DUF4382 domain-containing protein [Dehalococcoidia bacterium]
MRKGILVLAITMLFIISIMLVSCGGGVVGTLQFHANGEDFVRQGFVSKDGWSISFSNVYITLAEVTACQTDPPYDPHSDANMKCDVEVSLDKVCTVDLAEGGENALPILVGEVQNAAVGHYNALSWEMVKATSGPAAGYSLVILGTAEKDNQSIDFSIKVDEEYEYFCGEYVGDERKGMIEEGGTADVEMTFHFDHIFGDAETPMDNTLNVSAIGFEPFAGIAEGGKLDVNMADLQSRLSLEDYQMLVDILSTLGHVGEGHCHCD